MSVEIHYLREAGMVTAYVGDGDPYDPNNADATIIALAERFYQSRGATFSGWVVRGEISRSYSDPIPNKASALAQLYDLAAEEAVKFERPRLLDLPAPQHVEFCGAKHYVPWPVDMSKFCILSGAHDKHRDSLGREWINE
jgi:hypothetical protein